MSTTTFDTAVTQARDLLRWHSPLRTELWAARLTAGLEPGQVGPFLRELAEDGSAESRLTLVALAAVNAADRAGVDLPPGDAVEELPAGAAAAGTYAGAGDER
ncbi:hypothetical protein, partial [Nonomuraea basaltis]|uniref:hypothetical protein n=1 Tax=Nonomuraea basaltis TaxID=2495887 RepID=UPI00110C6B5C